MTFLHTFFKQKSVVPVTVAVVISVLFLFSMVQAATTISTNINTGGTLTVTGHSTLSTASTSAISLSSSLFVDGFATTTENNGNFATDGTLTVVGNSVLASFDVGGAFSTGGSGATIDATGKLQINGDFEVNGNATTTSAGVLSAESSINVASSTPSEQLNVTGDVSVGSTATTTLFIDSTSADSGACLQLRGADTTLYRVYIAASTSDNGAEFVIETGTCQP